LIFNSGNDIDREISIIAKIRDQLIDGLILMTNHADDDGRLAQAISAAGGVVLTDEDVPAAGAPRVFAENTKGARLAIAHLIEMGHRDIAFIGGPEQLLSSRERFQGYYETMREAGLSFRSEWVVYGSYLEEAGAAAFRQLWAGPVRPTAIFASADLLAIGVIRAARAVGVRVPDDVSLVGFDDTTNMDLIAPPLTTLRTSSEAYGRISVELLLASLSEVYAGPRTQRIGVELVRRNSVLPR
jgi:LacI family transcriptional regulator